MVGTIVSPIDRGVRLAGTINAALMTGIRPNRLMLTARKRAMATNSGLLSPLSLFSQCHVTLKIETRLSSSQCRRINCVPRVQQIQKT
eukprot:3737754-Amphidinium_carterae.1